MSDVTCCPKCGSKRGFHYTVTIKYQMVGEWGYDAQVGMQKTIAKTQAVCMGCKKRVPISVAEQWGLSK